MPRSCKVSTVLSPKIVSPVMCICIVVILIIGAVTHLMMTSQYNSGVNPRDEM